MNEFYTYKDFPVITEETKFDVKLTKNKFKPFIFGVVSEQVLTGTQGYKIELNDMHGKVKKIANYAIADNNTLEENPYNYVQYNYKSNVKAIQDPILNQVKRVNALESSVNYWDYGQQRVLQGQMSIDYDMSHDMRYTKSHSIKGGGNANFDWAAIFATGSFVPNFSDSKSELQLAVTNKVIHRGGVLESVESYNQGSITKTRNLVYDKLTGIPILTAVNNNFDDEIFSYNHLAYWEYEGMGPSYKNSKFQFVGDITNVSNDFYTVKLSNEDARKLVPGDELVISPKKGNGVTIYEHQLERGGVEEWGRSLTFKEDIQNLEKYNFNDMTSWIDLTPAYSITVYKDIFSGTSKTFTEDVSFERGTEFRYLNDEITSFKLHYDTSYDKKYKAYYLGLYEDKEMFVIENFNNFPENAEAEFTVTRSGARNHLGSSVMNVSALQNPLENRIEKNCDAEVLYPELGPKEMQLFKCSNQWIEAFNTFFKYINGELPVDPTNIFDCKRCGDLGEYEYGIRNFSDGRIVHSLVWPIYDDCSYYTKPSESGVRYITLNSVSNGESTFFRPFWGRVAGNYTYYGFIPPEEDLLEVNRNSSNANNHVTKRYFRDYDTGDTININTISRIIDIQVDSTNLSGWNSTSGSSGWYFNAEICYEKGYDDFPNFPETTTSLTGRDPDLYHCVEKRIEFIGEGYNNIIPFKRQFNTISTVIKNYPITYQEIDGVINISAQTFTDGWTKNFSGYTSENSILSSKNPYTNGERGVWVPHKTYAYENDRTQSANVNLKEDGTYNDVALFNFAEPFFENCTFGWKNINTITQYDPHYNAIENKDILGNYSSAQFGYKGTLQTIVANNAKEKEIGFQGFEEGMGNSSGNLLFYSSPNQILEEKLYKTHDIEKAKGNVIYTGIPIEQVSKVSLIKVRAATNSSNQYMSRFSEKTVETIQKDEANNAIFVLKGGIVNGGAPYPDFPSADGNKYWKGQIAIPSLLVKPNNSNPVSINNVRAHTGNNSLKMTSNQATFYQNKLLLEKGKNYIVEAWVSKDQSNKHYSYKDEISLSLNQSIGTPVGNIIDGWQKIRFETGPIQDPKNLSLVLNSTTTEPTYLDDIRISPIKASLVSYVYDANNYRLKAMLDQNNYATFYRYDEEGNLSQVLKETEEGIKTIQESKVFIQEN